MRRPDFSSMLHILTQQECAEKGENRLDYASLVNALSWICHSAKPSDIDALMVAAHIIRRFGPQTRISHAHRNSSIVDQIDTNDIFFTKRNEEIQQIAGANELSTNRINKIYRGKTASLSLARFAENVHKGHPPSAQELEAAKSSVARIRKRLMAQSGKGEALRAQVCVGFGMVGKTALADENFTEIESLKEKIGSTTMAIKSVADQVGLFSSKVKTDYQRGKAKRTRDLDDAVKAANEDAVVTDAEGNIVHCFPAVTRDDMKLDKPKK